MHRGVDALGQLLVVHRGQPERLAPVAGVGADPGAGELVELVVGEVGAILGSLEEERDFAELVLSAWLETTEATRTEAFDAISRRLDEARQQHEGAKALDDALFGEDFETA